MKFETSNEQGIQNIMEDVFHDKISKLTKNIWVYLIWNLEWSNHKVTRELGDPGPKSIWIPRNTKYHSQKEISLQLSRSSTITYSIEIIAVLDPLSNHYKEQKENISMHLNNNGKITSIPLTRENTVIRNQENQKDFREAIFYILERINKQLQNKIKTHKPWEFYSATITQESIGIDTMKIPHEARNNSLKQE